MLALSKALRSEPGLSVSIYVVNYRRRRTRLREGVRVGVRVSRAAEIAEYSFVRHFKQCYEIGAGRERVTLL